MMVLFVQIHATVFWFQYFNATYMNGIKFKNMRNKLQTQYSFQTRWNIRRENVRHKNVRIFRFFRLLFMRCGIENGVFVSVCKPNLHQSHFRLFLSRSPFLKLSQFQTSVTKPVYSFFSSFSTSAQGGRNLAKFVSIVPWLMVGSIWI